MYDLDQSLNILESYAYSYPTKTYINFMTKSQVANNAFCVGYFFLLWVRGTSNLDTLTSSIVLNNPKE